MAERVGIVGMGLMGQAMLANLLREGYAVQGFDVDSRRMDQLRAHGGEPVESPAATARGVGLVLTSLPTSADVRDVVLGKDGIVEGAGEGLLIVDTTTSRPEDSAALAEELAPRGIHFVDAAVSGTSEMAKSKDLIVIAGGRAEDFESCRQVLAGFSRAAYYMGPSGSGALTKLVINLVLMGNAFALMEGMVLGMKAGIDGERLIDVLKDGAAGSKVMDQKGHKLIEADYEPEGRLTIAMKDVGLMLEQGRRYGTPMLLTSLYFQVASSAAQLGYKDLDYSVIMELLREMAGLPRRA
ncbi:MAG: NAD(P)-dependent oxidoreductase [Dehalococcoidia bacterium]